MLERVYSVQSLSLIIEKSQPPVLILAANGLASTAGWTNPVLRPLFDEENYPADGILIFEFVAEAPTNIVKEILTPIEAQYVFKKSLVALSTVIVIAKTNSMKVDRSRAVTNDPKLENGNFVSFSESNTSEDLALTVARGYSDAYDLGEAIRNAMKHIPHQNGEIADFLASYVVVNIGAEVGGIAGFNRLFVDLQG